MGKRVFDIGVALCVLLALSPLLVAVAIWVKLDSQGPVLFRQQRIGLRGRPFAILKFRTMRHGATGEGSRITVGADPRITRAGAFLRRYKIDEFPQFINVLRGEMSVVGPRPEVPHYVALYTPAQRDTVLSVRPGITDSASLVFKDESTLLAEADAPEAFYVTVVMPAKLAHAERYVATRSLLGDIKIVLRTAGAIVVRRQGPAHEP
jgi:lipopolysaccharide/colanic/teichoic acid biosynthesis glycosyltransferase